jgi:death-on-curing family protein
MSKTHRTRTQPITVELIKYIAHALARETMGWDKPILPFETRYQNVLESCINTHFQPFERKLLYRGVELNAAMLFYLLIKNHPFQNGNKRVAVVSPLVFLALNGRWLRVDRHRLYSTAVWVAASDPEAREDVVSYIQKFIKKHSVPVQPFQPGRKISSS